MTLLRKNSEATHQDFGFIDSSDLAREERWITSLVIGRSGKKKILKYNFERLVKVSAVMTVFVRGTVFNLDRTIYHSMSMYGAIFLLSFVGLYFLGDPLEFEKDSLPPLEEVSTNVQRFCPFLFGLFISIVLSRWWSIRTNAVGEIANQVINVSGLLVSMGSRILKRDEDWELFKENHKQLVKYGIASISCCGFESRGSSFNDIASLVAEGLLTDEEHARLSEVCKAGFHTQSIALWCWIQSLATEMFEMMKIPSPNHNMVFQEIRAAMNGIHCLHDYLRTQLPFPYVHLICLLVNVNNAMMSGVAGLKFAIALEAGIAARCFAEVLQVVMVPLLYQGLLQVSVFLSDPLGDDLLDFPLRQYQLEISHSCASQLATRTLWQHRIAMEASPLPNAHVVRSLGLEKATEKAPSSAAPPPPTVLPSAPGQSVTAPPAEPRRCLPPTPPEVAEDSVDKLTQTFEVLSSSISSLTEMVRELQVQWQPPTADMVASPPVVSSSTPLKAAGNHTSSWSHLCGVQRADAMKGQEQHPQH
eukprot:TRINITY_DN17564_c0_g2_i1.p1 TRINITY_DN17564_c0_g2~~TRINITY_DN17564_c0_g2_i1.p1  ORF type:complete len:531 (+),score=85.10 TRINITY_DN17564_c0_g2_i1:107-1699(+)